MVADAGAGDWNLDLDLEEGRIALDNQTGTDNIVCIQRMGRPMEDKSYTPHLVAIGPYHRRCPSPWVEKEKQRCVGFMQKLSVNRRTGGLNGIVRGLELQAREFYGHGVAGMPPKELARILLHDGCYLLRWLSIRPPESYTYKFGNTEHRDVLYLIENQMPFSALEAINQRAPIISATPLSNYLAGYVRPLLVARNYISESRQRLSPEVAPRHLLHLVHTYFQFHPTLQPSTEPPPQPLHQHNMPQVEAGIEMQPLQLEDITFTPSSADSPSTEPPPQPLHQHNMPQVHPSTEPQPLHQHNTPQVEVGNEMQPLLEDITPPTADSPPPEPTTGRWRRATDYRMDANLKFMRRDFADDVTCVLDVCLEGGRTLWIPCLKVDSNTWTLLRNLMVLEEQMPKRPVTAYCTFMSQVACTVEDVRLLVDAKIVQHFLGSDEIAAQGFADLCERVVMDVDNIDRNYLKPIWHQLEELCRSRRRRFMGSFRQKYFSKGLHRVAFGITVFLALCQLLQALYAPIAYHFPKKGS